MKTLLEEPIEGAEGASNELIKMIRKLRWIGMEQEAEQLQRALSARPPNERGSVLAGPNVTD
jgi:hypothetical protein